MIDNYTNFAKIRNWNSGSYGMVNNEISQSYKYFFEKANIKLNEINKVIDFGCGNGNTIGWLLSQKKSLKITGIDNLQENYDNFTESKFKNEISFKKSLDEIDKNEKVDLIIALNVIEHLTYLEIIKIFAKFEQILKPDGKILLSFPNCNGVLGITNQFTDPTHISLITPTKIENAISGINLELIQFKPKISKSNQNFLKKSLRFIFSLILRSMGIVLNLDYLATRNCYCVLKKN